MSEAKFYDAHCHIMNLSHPNLLAFLQRLNLPMIMLLAPILPFLLKRNYNKIKNLLSVMENDLGTILLMMERFLLKDEGFWENGRLRIGGNLYSKIVLTPLLMDFGYKGRTDPGIYYNLPSQKPIVEQVCDLFNGIRKYTKESKNRLFAIYPFLGLNTQNYPLNDETSEKVIQRPDLGQLNDTLRQKVKYNVATGKLTFYGKMLKKEEQVLERLFNNDQDKHGVKLLFDKSQKIKTRTTLRKLLNKYFADYHALPEELAAKQGKFTGNIDRMGCNFFAGIKVYPPLGYDPWPEDDPVELAKVKLLYEYCSAKRIPITSHCNSGGFVVTDKKFSSKITSPYRWERVLNNYPELILNLAHFGKENKKFMLFPAEGWTRKIIKMIDRFDYLYVDFSFNGLDKDYYRELRRYIDGSPAGLREKLKQRILFGSDFMINLTGVESYNEYLKIFSESPYFSLEEKQQFCTVNAERFLFGEKGVTERIGVDEEVAVSWEG
ncbi:MAG: amidohydrolase family protein [Firmicutes bacterium]|nr:amidohydrolase family protein [Bacillota bacterium]